MVSSLPRACWICHLLWRRWLPLPAAMDRQADALGRTELQLKHGRGIVAHRWHAGRCSHELGLGLDLKIIGSWLLITIQTGSPSSTGHASVFTPPALSAGCSRPHLLCRGGCWRRWGSAMPPTCRTHYGEATPLRAGQWICLPSRRPPQGREPIASFHLQVLNPHPETLLCFCLKLWTLGKHQSESMALPFVTIYSVSSSSVLSQPNFTELGYVSCKQSQCISVATRALVSGWIQPKNITD